MGSLVDTILNVMVFAFIGLMIWLYLKKTPADDPSVDAIREENE